MAIKSASSSLLLGGIFRRIYGRCSSTLAMELKKLTAEAAFSRQPVIRTSESDPANHTSGHIGLFYTIPPEDADRWISRGLSKRAYRSHQAFNETCLMVRSPGVELVSFLRAADYSVPNVRYIVYGRPGCGKSTTLAYLMHYCGRAGWFIVHEPWLPWHLRYSRDVEPSTFQPGLVDYPLYAAGWLAYFQKMNEHLLSPPDGSSPPVIANRYVWNKREAAEVGSPLKSLIEFGLARVKYSSDVMGAVLKELRHSGSAGLSRVLVAIDGLNVCWGGSDSRHADDRWKFRQAGEFTSIQQWRRMLQLDWSGGAVVCTIDGLAPRRDRNHLKFKPLELLGAENFKTMDPFVPVYVPEYSVHEAVSCIEYYRDRKFIVKDVAATEAGRKELIALSCCNPEELYRVAVNW